MSTHTETIAGLHSLMGDVIAGFAAQGPGCVTILQGAIAALEAAESPTTPEVPFITRNIVNQLGELWNVPVVLRQATNDRADVFVAGLIRKIIAQPATTVEWGVRALSDEDGPEFWLEDEHEARSETMGFPGNLVTRTAIYGPWEVVAS